MPHSFIVRFGRNGVARFERALRPERHDLRDIYMKDITDRAGNAFSDIYFVGLGVFQSIVAGQVCERFFEYEAHAEMSAHTVLIYLHFALSALQIPCVMFSYWWWVVLVQRRPQLMDIMLPFAAGFCEFGQIQHVEVTSKWGLWVGLLCFIGLFALIRSFRGMCETRIFESEDQRKVVRVARLFGRWGVSMATVTLLGGIAGVAGYAMAGSNWPLLRDHAVIARFAYSITLIVLALGYVLVERWYLNRFQEVVPFERKSRRPSAREMEISSV
jgi:hypothetical protein